METLDREDRGDNVGTTSKLKPYFGKINEQTTIMEGQLYSKFVKSIKEFGRTRMIKVR